MLFDKHVSLEWITPAMTDTCVMLMMTDEDVMPATTNRCVMLTFGACGGVASSCHGA